MPTIKFSLKDLQHLVGRKLNIVDLENLLHYAKGEIEGYDKTADEISVSFDDTNLPYLWSAEGVARLLKGILGLRKPKIKIEKSGYKIIVENSVKKVRPFIAAFVAKGKKIDDYFLKQLVQLQEKFCDNYGRKREKASIGLYSYKRITFPVYYKAVAPDSVSFIPLEFHRKLNLRQILKEHPKGRDYGFILESAEKYPLLVDRNNEILSFPPIINSNFTGKVEVGDEELLFEVTGTDEETINLAANIFAYALYERGFKIYSVEVAYHERKVITPLLKEESIKINKESIKLLLGLELKEAEIKKLIEKAGFGFNNLKISIPSYRADILHEADVIEDIGIMRGFDKIKGLPMKSYTVGETKPIIEFCDKLRELAIGLGYQEVLSPILTNKKNLYENMSIEDFGTVEIEKYMSESYSVVRSWLIPTLMEVLSKNRHVLYPQKIFEQGIVTTRRGNEIKDYERIAIVSCHTKADFTEMKQVLDFIMNSIGVSYEIEETEHNSFTKGRVGRVIVNGKKIAYLGEVHPIVLANWGVETPIAALELNLTELFWLLKEIFGF